MVMQSPSVITTEREGEGGRERGGWGGWGGKDYPSSLFSWTPWPQSPYCKTSHVQEWPQYLCDSQGIQDLAVMSESPVTTRKLLAPLLERKYSSFKAVPPANYLGLTLQITQTSNICSLVNGGLPHSCVPAERSCHRNPTGFLRPRDPHMTLSGLQCCPPLNREYLCLSNCILWHLLGQVLCIQPSHPVGGRGSFQDHRTNSW